MKISSLILTLFCGICFSVSAQVDSFQGKIIEYLNHNGTEAVYSETYDAMFIALKKQFDAPSKVWTELKSDKHESMQDAIRLLSFVYRKHFTEEEISSMTVFYKSEAGQKFVNGSNNHSEEEREEIETFFNSDLGRKMESKQSELSKGMKEVTVYWKKDLFAQKMVELLKTDSATRQ